MGGDGLTYSLLGRIVCRPSLESKIKAPKSANLFLLSTVMCIWTMSIERWPLICLYVLYSPLGYTWRIANLPSPLDACCEALYRPTVHTDYAWLKDRYQSSARCQSEGVSLPEYRALCLGESRTKDHSPGWLNLSAVRLP